MINKSLLVILALAVAWAFWAYPAAAVGRQYIEVGLGYRWFDYEEELEPPLRSNETGRLPSARFAYGYQGVDNPIYAELSFRYTAQSTDYDGTTQSGTPVKDSSDNTWWNYEFLAGYIVRNVLDSPIRVIPYSGVGYKVWERNLNGSSPYSEEYAWFYLPVGVRVEVPVTPEFTFGVDASVRIMFGGIMQLDFDEPAYDEPELNLGNRVGYKLQMPMSYLVNSRFSVMVNPWYEYTRFGASDWKAVTTEVYNEITGEYDKVNVFSVKEPSSDTHEYGVDVGVRIYF
jgi:opacity protein-like surface antigen